MKGSLGISGAALLACEIDGQSLTILSEKDHLLRRFGSVQLISLAKDSVIERQLDPDNDFIWSAVDGQVAISLHDQREQSPSFETNISIDLDAALPQKLLVPFGVAIKIEALKASQLILITTQDI